MNVLIACEFSGVVREAFRALGHDAISCDLLPAEDGSPHHIQGDAIRAVQSRDWDMVIAHPPCTFLANSGVRWLYHADGSKNEDRWLAMQTGAAFFSDLWRACSDIPRIAFENPVMHKHARAIISRWSPDVPAPHYIQPWQHGHGEIKATGLYLKGLPPLTPSSIVDGRTPRVHHASPGPDRWKERSRTLAGIAKAMADQWGAHSPILLDIE